MPELKVSVETLIRRYPLERKWMRCLTAHCTEAPPFPRAAALLGEEGAFFRATGERRRYAGMPSSVLQERSCLEPIIREGGWAGHS